MTTTRRDLDLDYLLGEFDAERMIRLEGLHYADDVARELVGLQRDFPTTLRNVAYVTSAIDLTPGPADGVAHEVTEAFARFPLKLHDDGTYELWVARPAMGLNVPWLATPMARMEAELDGPDLDMPGVPDMIDYRTAHEHGHFLALDLWLADELHGTRSLDEIDEAIATVVPGFTNKKFHRFTDQLRKAGLSRYGTRNYGEFLAEVFAENRIFKDQARAVAKAAHPVLMRYCHRDSGVREDLQRRTLEQCPREFLVPMAENAQIERARRELPHEGDMRFAALVLDHDPETDPVVLGAERISQLCDAIVTAVDDDGVPLHDMLKRDAVEAFSDAVEARWLEAEAASVQAPSSGPTRKAAPTRRGGLVLRKPATPSTPTASPEAPYLLVDRRTAEVGDESDCGIPRQAPPSEGPPVDREDPGSGPLVIEI